VLLTQHARLWQWCYTAELYFWAAVTDAFEQLRLAGADHCVRLAEAGAALSVGAVYEGEPPLPFMNGAR